MAVNRVGGGSNLFADLFFLHFIVGASLLVGFAGGCQFKEWLHGCEGCGVRVQIKAWQETTAKMKADFEAMKAAD